MLQRLKGKAKIVCDHNMTNGKPEVSWWGWFYVNADPDLAEDSDADEGSPP